MPRTVSRRKKPLDLLLLARNWTWRPDLLTVVSAVCVVLAFPPWGLFWLIWVALVPWFFTLERVSSFKEAVTQGVWFSVVMCLGGFSWVGHAISEFGELPGFVGFLGLFLFSLIGEPQFYFFAAVHALVFRSRLSRAENQTRPFRTLGLGMLAAFVYVGLDWISPKIFVDTLGHSLWSAQRLRQVADLGGAWCLTFLIFVVNDAVYFVLRGVAVRKTALLKAALAVSLVAAYWFYGHFRLQEVRGLLRETTDGVQVAAVQANIGDIYKVAAERGVANAAREVMDEYIRLSQEALDQSPRPQLVVWPETAYPSTFGNARTARELELEAQVNQFIREFKTPLLFGGYDTIGRKDYNAFFFLGPKDRLQAYHKSILLFIGEYIPGAETFDGLKNLFPQVGNFGRGGGPTVVPVSYSVSPGHAQTGVVRITPIICYEALFSNFVLESTRQGSQAIFNITNDGWFGAWGEPHLHLALSTFRTIETRLPLFRSTNTGITALVLPDGEIQKSIGVGDRAVMNVRIPLLKPIPTLLKAWGDWWGPMSLMLGLVGVLMLRPKLPRKLT